VSAAVLATLVVGLLAGCAPRVVTNSGPRTTTAPSTSYAPIGAAEACPTAAPVHLPDDVGPVDAAYACVRQTRPVQGDGEWAFLVVRRVTSGLDALLLAYRTADAPLTTDACDASGVVPRLLYLHGSRTLAVRAPLDRCGKPIPAATGAYAALGTVDITALKLAPVTSQLSQTSGCPDMYKDMLAIDQASGDPRQTSKVPSPVEPGAELCSYAVTRDPHGYRFVWLSSARRLTRTDVSRINSALAGATVDASCSRHTHTRFALLGVEGATTLVALDGCAVQQDGGWWRATDRLRALVTA
jgi:hypothetical protein